MRWVLAMVCYRDLAVGLSLRGLDPGEVCPSAEGNEEGPATILKRVP